MRHRFGLASLLFGCAAVIALTVAPAAAGTSCSTTFTGSTSSCTLNLAGTRQVVSAYAVVSGPTGSISVTLTGPGGVVLASCTNSSSAPGSSSTGVGCYDAVGVPGVASPGLAALSCSVTVTPPATFYGNLGCSSGGV